MRRKVFSLTFLHFTLSYGNIEKSVLQKGHIALHCTRHSSVHCGTGLAGEGKGGKGNQTMSLFWNSFEHLTSLMASLKILYDIRKYYFHNSFCNKVNL